MSEQNAIMTEVGDAGIPVCAETPASDGATRSLASITVASRALEALKWMFSFPSMLGALLVGNAFWVGRAFAVDPDMWWHIKLGQSILATHHWPTADPYSFTVSGQPWIAFEWLGDVLMGAVARIGGVRGLDALMIALGSAVMIALYVFATIRSGNSKAGFLSAGALFFLADPSFSMRPQMLGYLFLVLALIALELFRQGKQGAVWFLPPLLLLWVNAHGSFIIGLGVILLYLVCGVKGFRLGAIEAKQWTPKERMRLEFVFLLCLAVLPITPYGTELAAFPLRLSSSIPMSVAHIAEWQPMPFNLLGGKIFVALVLGFFVIQMAFDLKCRVEELILFLGGVAMACLHVRFILLFVPFFAPFLAVILARWLPHYDRARDKYIVNAALITCVLAAMVHYFPSRAFLDKKIAENYPSKAVEYIQQHPIPGPMFNNYGFGGYLIWSLGPEHKVFIDGRSEVYEKGGVLADYFHIMEIQPGALTVLRNYGIQSCLIERETPLATVLASLPDWQKVYSDDTTELFVRRKIASASHIALTNANVLGE